MHQKTFAELVKMGREIRNWTQDDLAKKAGVSKEYISRIENDKNVPGIGTRQKLLEAFKNHPPQDAASIILPQELALTGTEGR